MVKKKKKRSYKKRANLALVLSGGAARGMAHIGVLEILQKHNISPDIVIGVSSGALVGGMYVSGNLKKFKKVVTHKTKSQWHRIFSIWPKKGGIIQTKHIEKEMRKIIGRQKIEDLDKKFFTGAVDLISGKNIFIGKGDLINAILPSISIPIVFPPYRKGKMLLVDGGLEDPLPIDLGFKLAKKVIAVDITRSIDEMPKKKNYGFLSVMERVTVIVQNEITDFFLDKYHKNLVVIRPNVNLNTLDFNRSRQAINIGKKEANKNIEDIKKLLKS